MAKCYCGKTAVFNISTDNRGKYCKAHRENGMIDVVNPRCHYGDCKTRPIYNAKGEKKGKYCKDHRLDGMIDVVNPKCENDDCIKQPVFNVRGKKKGRFCKDHCLDGMVDVVNQRCEDNGCEKIPTCNFPGINSARFCTEHKIDGMIDIISIFCEMDDCQVRAVYNIQAERKGRFCKDHKLDGMVDVINKKCEIDDCNTRPSFNFRGIKKGRFCMEHKLDGMICITHPLCDYENCNTRATCGLLGRPATRCSRHRQQGTIRYPTRICCNNRCKLLGTHEYEGQRYCQDHSPQDAINLGIATCIVCGFDDVLTYGKCSTCDPQIIIIHRHIKEERIKDILTAEGIPFIHDSILDSMSCGRERPDFQIDCGTHYIYVEVDENQHDSYPCECEQIRMINIVNVRGMPVRWIRYNPDVYEPIKGQQQMKKEKREEKLLEHIIWGMQHSPQEDGNFSSIMYLFYDEHDTKNQPWLKLI
jgi:hypothetical protein